MSALNEFLRSSPFDLYDLALFQLVAHHRSFTKAAAGAGLTQSALTRQIQGLEESLAVPLLERTTRQVRLTEAGAFLLQEATTLLGGAERTARSLHEQFANARKEIRVGVSNSIGLAYLPGFFHANLRHFPEVACRVSSLRSAEIQMAVEAGHLDLGLLCPPRRLPKSLHVTHRFADRFTVLAPKLPSSTLASATKSPSALQSWLREQNWLLLSDASNTGRLLREWLKGQRLPIEPIMQLDSFDLIINLVALGMGVSVVPIRALALYGRRRTYQRMPSKTAFVRELVVVQRKQRRPPEHLVRFVENILF